MHLSQLTGGYAQVAGSLARISGLFLHVTGRLLQVVCGQKGDLSSAGSFFQCHTLPVIDLGNIAKANRRVLLSNIHHRSYGIACNPKGGAA